MRKQRMMSTGLHSFRLGHPTCGSVVSDCTNSLRMDRKEEQGKLVVEEMKVYREPCFDDADDLLFAVRFFGLCPCAAELGEVGCVFFH